MTDSTAATAEPGGAPENDDGEVASRGPVSANGVEPTPASALAGAGKPRSRWRRRLLQVGALGLAAVFGLWVAVHNINGFGPAVADGLRAVFGPGFVAWLEDTAYGIQDRINRWRYEDAEPKVFWTMPSDVPVAAPPPPASASSGAPGPAPFAPPRFPPPEPKVAAEGDGVWIPVVDPQRKDHFPVLYKAMVHPDARRSFAVLALVALDVRAFDLKLLPGSREPRSNRLKLAERPGHVPKSDYETLYAAFNGGFKTTHGHYGMMVEGVELLPPRDIACTFIKLKNGEFRIGTWSRVKGEASAMEYYRQTPPCLVEDGKVHVALNNEYAKGWGATVSGETVIRRSAIGLDADRKILFYGIGDAMTAQSLARGMAAAGARWAAELDVNYSYPRFLFYERPDPARPPVATTALIKGLQYTRYQYVGHSSLRDFFYLTRKPVALP